MPAGERGFVREIALEGWRDIRSRPLMLLIVSASTLPFVFLLNFLLTPTNSGIDMILSLGGYAVCFALYFLFWCMAVVLYDTHARSKKDASYKDAFNRMEGWAWPSFLAGLLCGLVSIIAFLIAQIVVGILLSFLAAGQTSGTSITVLQNVAIFLTYIVADAAIVFIALVPQMLQLERGRKVEEVLRASYHKIKEHYKDALLLFILPDLVTKILITGSILLILRIREYAPLFVLLLLVFSILEAGRIVFVAASFNHLYYYLLEEEKQKRKAKPKKQPQKQAKRK
ncbi:MAG: hypothetical protein A2V52_07695 [Actinobacteria bacterium RBG_19FT_COMBO_54_7]|uniref:DUF975 family protein n=1 Tax=Candidatus Solincola sediminis TaxID=1797199 RepID=A0A1F2WK88_9ACTN|nr:MAG: hypothetical protein A2Y75_07510 [Candidatus Solincola sediminis]OFW58832.1 MAG: hypothetical protein A2W01_01815 [Candidatus Solincola sediminis]OFW66498.1 MAG: hypothetical protein A2V52_07695 [Actinobacteria bacterium RBG_19FT_COMBO_54_7]